MVPVVMVGVSVHQEFRASQEALDPRDQQVLRDHPVIMDPKDPWAHGEAKAKKEPVEDRDLPAPAVTKVKPVSLVPRDPQVQLVPLEAKVIQVHVESKVPLVPRDLKEPQVQLVPLETRVIRVLQVRLVVTGNSALLKLATAGTLD